MEKNKILYLTQQFQKGVSNTEETPSLYIEGYANTTSVDRSGDVIPMTAWQTAMDNYLKNPIILAYHDHDDPIGRMEDYRVDTKGLWVKARISAAAEEVYNLIKDGVLTAFSVGFRVKDATYDAATDLFVIKDLELLEISVVSVPCNQDSTFSLSKSFDSTDDYSQFKSQFTVKKEESKEMPPSAPKTPEKTKKEWNMDPKELEQLLAKAAADAAAAATKALEDKQAAEKAAKEAEVKRQAEIDAAVQKAVAGIQVGQSGAEKLLEEVEKRFASQEATLKSVADLQASLTEKAEELKKIQESKMQFGDKSSAAGDVTYAEKEKAVLLASIMRKGIKDTRYGQGLIEKFGAHLTNGTLIGSATWETEVSTNMYEEIRRRLVMAPLFRNIDMQTNVLKVPVNPEAGFATWVNNTSFGTTASPGTAQTHQLKDLTLNTYKLATMEYVAYEEEEDSLLVLLPIIRDAMIRRVARSWDKAYLYDASAPFSGVAALDTTSATTITNTGTVTVANLRSLRKDNDTKVWALNPADVIYIVSTETYYDLLEDTTFQTMDKVGPVATILTGQIGSVGGSPVLVSDAFPTRAGGTASSNTNIGAVCVAPANFLAGQQRGLRFDTQDLVETQRKVLVASVRTGLTQFSSVNGSGVSTLRFT